MKKNKGFSVAGVVIGVVVAALLGIATYAIIDGSNKATDYGKYDFTAYIEATKDNGNIADHVKGDKDAPVVIVEYADYQCPGCASLNTYVNRVVEELDGKLAVVYRNFLLSYHQNATAAASAAEAAGFQGYWKQFADKLFSEQAEWEYATASERTEYFNQYFEEVTEGKGDLDKFNSDISSAAVSKKISFDMGMAKRVGVGGTPAFYIDGVLINWGATNGDSITINGETLSWDSGLTGAQFMELLKNIVKAKIGE